MCRFVKSEEVELKKSVNGVNHLLKLMQVNLFLEALGITKRRITTSFHNYKSFPA